MKDLVQKETTQPTTTQRYTYIAPSANIHQSDEGFGLEIEMPGVTKDQVELSVEDGKLTIVGHCFSDSSEKGWKALHQESERQAYRRVFDLDPGIHVEQITAVMEQGLLKVQLPKQEALKPRKITVQ